jgi:hypothetical protein
MSLEHFDDRRKGMSRRAKEMAKAAKVVGPGVRNLALYDETDKEKRVHVAKLLAANVEQPGFVGAFVSQAQIVNENGRKQAIVREGQVRDALVKWALETPNLMTGWPWNEMAVAFGVTPTDKRLERIFKGVTVAIRKLGFVAERYDGAFKVMTKAEVAVKQARTLANIQGQASSRAAKGKALMAGGFEPNGRLTVQMAWWDLPQFKALEGGAG